jgi:hypothetical protein
LFAQTLSFWRASSLLSLKPWYLKQPLLLGRHLLCHFSWYNVSVTLHNLSITALAFQKHEAFFGFVHFYDVNYEQGQYFEFVDLFCTVFIFL